jgi:hypothetical protein
LENHEAASLRWVPLTAPHELDLEVDQLALASISGSTVVRRDQGDEGVETVRCRTPAVHRTGARVARPPAGDCRR